MKIELQHFLLRGASLRSAVDTSLAEQGVKGHVTAIEKFSDALIKGYVSVASSENRQQADRMASYYKLFYLLENEIRSFIVDLIESSNESDWWLTKVPENVRLNAAKNLERERREGIIPRSDRMIDYTTFGELGEIIKANWDVFGGVFSRHDKAGVEKVLQQLNMLRGPIAHCGVLGEDDVVKLKLVVRNWYRLME
ncbi:Swt1 family HEPN domain-containing protein [Mesorhizobium abyssinicae]|uniref:Swt1 family HEPN domain-containing protein n=1 Tax=Mesorhizobium abyssinicae TaxID=1209958 RepID=A0ABU5AXU6_9HYPH|nr:Swt1 family HEPN domain-containing protein [Mesorhizobium abyssinicae]MDX8542046.1 Swt1 family HEPN domain-containing protein [Mesorhizobium abyssinicae]